MDGVVTARRRHIDELLSIGLRQADVDELWASSKATPEDALIRSYEKATVTWSILLDDRCIGMFGVGGLNILSPVGMPWMLASDMIRDKRVWRRFLREGREYWIDNMHDLYPVLVNWIDARNTVSLRWAKWVGFRVFEPEPFGPFGMPFHRIERKRGDK